MLAVAAARSFETISLAQEQVGLFTSMDIGPGEYIESDIDSSYWGQRTADEIVKGLGYEISKRLLSLAVCVNRDE